MTNIPAINTLIDKLWNGEISEKAFLEAGLAIGFTPAHLHTELDNLREEDGLLEGVAR